jgi:hypothetical protein
MINYHVKKKRRTRYTYRFVGISIAFLCASQVVMFIMGYGRTHKIATILCFAFALYGLFLFVNSFRAGAYDADYEFRDEDFIVHTKWGDRHYTYGDVNDVSHVIPENENLYSLIHISVKNKDYVLPFSYKKEVADKIYTYVNDRVIAKKLEDMESDKSE